MMASGVSPQKRQNSSRTPSFSWQTSSESDSWSSQLYGEVMEAMASVGMPVQINVMPNEIPDAIPFPDDTKHAAYEPAHARALWRARLDTHRVFTRFRAGYLGKASPVHFFWGSFDLAVSRFSGRLAPPHPGGLPNFPDDVAREAYSHELTSCGFWPGNRSSQQAIFYAYAYPTPEGYSAARVEPDDAFWLDGLGEFVLPYEVVASAPDPDATLLSFVRRSSRHRHHRAPESGRDPADALDARFLLGRRRRVRATTRPTSTCIPGSGATVTGSGSRRGARR